MRRAPGGSSATPADGRDSQADAPGLLRRDVLRFLRVRERTGREVDDYLKRETRGMSFYMDELNERSPFKQGVEK